jgi:XTP/dITP diphosphohydrolase
MPQLILASRKKKKIREFKRMLEQSVSDIEVLSLLDFPEFADVEETGTTLQENSRLKAVAITELTGKPCLADDSGLFVDALGGDPGVYSARWSGVHGDDLANTAKVLQQLHELEVNGPVTRSAQFRCVVALSFPKSHSRAGEVHFESGEMRGEIIDKPRGDHGFGYDPNFLPHGYAQTSAQLSAEEKDRISHRGQAIRKILPVLIAALAGPH